MKSRLAGFLAVSCLVAIHPIDLGSAEACGVKLTIKSPGPRKAIARTSNPSAVLLVGKPPPRLKRDLAAAGHSVDVTPSPGEAKRASYAVVIADSNDHASAARSQFPEAKVIVRSGDVATDLRTVEARVARTPVGTPDDRVAVRARPARPPVAAGPEQERPKEVVAVKESTETPAAAPAPAPTPAPAPAPAPTRVTTTTARAETPPAPREVQTASALREEVHFATGGTDPSNKRALARAVRWLAAHADVRVTVEGHADPVGTPERNMTLSESRANNVRDLLVAEGIDESRIDVAAFGDTRLKYGRTDGRNRRVTIEAKRD
jgi:peptidoglycan-associated lipoprotein